MKKREAPRYRCRRAALLETAQQPYHFADGLRHGPRREAEHRPTSGPFGVVLPPRAAPAEHQPTAGLPRRPNDPDRPPGRREQLQWHVPTNRSPDRQQLARLPIVHRTGTPDQGASQRLPRSVQTPLLPLQPGQDLPLPPFLDPLDPDRREVDRHAVLKPGAEQHVHVRVGGAVVAAVLMDGEDALGAPRGAAEGPLDGVAQNASERCPSRRWKRFAVGLSTVRA